MKRLSFYLLLSVVAIDPAAAQDQLTVERIWGSDEFASDLTQIQWAPDGQGYTRVESGPEGTNLLRIDAMSGERQTLVLGKELVPPGRDEPIRIESYQFSTDRSRVLIFANSIRVWRQNTKGEFFVWDFSAERLLPVSTKAGYQQFAKFSPDGNLVGFVRDNNLFVSDVSTGDEWQITADGSDDIINGTSDWVYEEELGLRDAFRISSDGQRIAFWRLDQSAIRPFYMIDETTLYPELIPVRYPKAGTPNSSVRLGVADIRTGETQWMDIGEDGDAYVARLDFADSPNEIWFTRLNRHQNRLDLMIANVVTGQSRIIMTDTDEAWVDQREPLWYDGGQRFLYLSERDGHAQIFSFSRDGTLLGKLTDGPWDVTAVAGVDQENGVVYFTGAGQGPLERSVYVVGLDGRGLRRITIESGTHAANFNPSFTLFVDTHSRAGVVPVQTLRTSDGEIVRTVSPNDGLRQKVEALDISLPEFTQIPIGNGEMLNAYLIKPPRFDPTTEHPLLMYVYGGPGSQTVTDAWGGQRYLWHQMLAQQGYVVASVDNRGTGARGRDFKKVTYQKLGQHESDDQIASARYFADLPYIDAERIGIWGWSYGGYMSALSIFRGAGVFSAAISVAPVTDWRLYDTIYTERYMRTPDENPDGYRLGAPLTYADKLRDKFLLVHGTGDDNVHSQQTTQMVLALEDANMQFDMRVYPNKTHSIGGSARVNLYTLFTEWLQENLYQRAPQLAPIP